MTQGDGLPNRLGACRADFQETVSKLPGFSFFHESSSFCDNCINASRIAYFSTSENPSDARRTSLARKYSSTARRYSDVKHLFADSQVPVRACLVPGGRSC